MSHLRPSRAAGAVAFIALLAQLSCRAESADDIARQGSTTLPPDVRRAPAAPARYGVGRAATSQEIRAWDIDVGPDGRDHPVGSGTHAQGAKVYASRCAMCHGVRGEGLGQGAAAFPKLVGRIPGDSFNFGRDPALVKTVGNYWPHASTLFDYVRRAMPFNAPGTLTNDETYAVVAYLLGENGIVPRDRVMDARALAQVRMPARERFIIDDRRGGKQFR